VSTNKTATTDRPTDRPTDRTTGRPKIVQQVQSRQLRLCSRRVRRRAASTPHIRNPTALSRRVYPSRAVPPPARQLVVISPASRIIPHPCAHPRAPFIRVVHSDFLISLDRESEFPSRALLGGFRADRAKKSLRAGSQPENLGVDSHRESIWNPMPIRAFLVNRSVTLRATHRCGFAGRKRSGLISSGICWEGGDRWFYNGSMHAPERNIALSNFHTITFEASPLFAISIVTVSVRLYVWQEALSSFLL